MGLGKKKLIILVIVIAVTAIGVTAYRAFSTGSAGMLQDFAGIVLTPIQKGIGVLTGKAADFFGYFTNVDALRAENAELHLRMNQLEEDLSDFERYQQENQRLKGYLGIKEEHPDFVFEMADIIAREPNHWFDVFTIDKGSIQGISAHDTVITQDGLVGYILETGSNWAKVVTILDPSCTFGVTVRRTKEVAVIEGDDTLRDRGQCRMSLLPPNNTVAKGDMIVTSGLGEIFPKGLEVGKVLEVRSETSGIADYAVIVPTVDLKNLKEVMVIKDFQAAE